MNDNLLIEELTDMVGSLQFMGSTIDEEFEQQLKAFRYAYVSSIKEILIEESLTH